MASVPTNVVAQPLFSHVHPNHSLMHHSDDRVYTCHACNTAGTGLRFRCHTCTVDVHVYCSNCPQELSSFLHATHRLALVPRMNNRACDVCRESIDGMFYRCDPCDFDAHPLCTQFPEQLRHVIDDLHKLRLRKLSSSGRCSVCEIDCSSLWVYGCDVCRVNIHPKCLLKPYGAQGSEKPAVQTSDSRGIPYGHAPPWATAQQPHFHWQMPHNHNGYPLPQHNYYGSVQFPQYNHPPRPNYGGPSPPSPSIWGSILGGSMFALVENLAIGAFTEFLFGSIGF